MLQVLSVASEVFPVIKTGGLADVVGALPGALRAHDVEVRTLIPGYPAVMAALEGAEKVWVQDEYFGGAARLLAGRAGGLDLFVLDAPHLFARAGNPYMSADGRDWADNPQRFASLAYAASLIGRGSVAGYVPDVVHAHDWQTGLAPAYLEYAGDTRPGTVMTIHNLAFQGQVPAGLLAALRLPVRAYTSAGVEYYGSIGMLKAGVRFADRVTTVSPSYAAEICTVEGGMGMDGLLRTRADDLVGILNGIDTQVWNPATDVLLPSTYGFQSRGKRAGNKAMLQARFGLKATRGVLLFGVVSRLSDQKGLDLLLACLPDLLAADAQLAVLGSGDAGLQAGFAAAAAVNPGRVGVEFGYDEAAAHLMQAGCDAILVPSRFEPCGLTQLCALRYGALPVVSRVGGLADTVIDANVAGLAANAATGVQFSPVTAEGLRGAIARTVGLWAQPDVWSRMQLRAMRSEVGWGAAAALYASLYRSLPKG
jgi:starch synthase